jgi:DNA-binding MurR/RpiR family transcriptional regulator
MTTALDDLRKLAERVREATQELEDLRLQRDEAIRNARRTTQHTVPEIAEAAGVSQATVKTVIRGIR